MRKSWSVHVALTLLVCCSFTPARAAVNGLEEVGHSFQADMRGGTEVAVGDTALSQVRQPAAVVLQTRVRFDGKISDIFPINKWNGLQHGDTFDTPANPNFAFAFDGPINDKTGWGLAVFSKTGWSGNFRNYKSPFLFFPTSQTSSASVLNYAAQINVGRRLTEKLSVGAGGRVELMETSSSTIYGPGKLTLGDQWSVGGGFNLGTLYKATQKIQLGAGYRSPSWMGQPPKGSFELINGVKLPARVPASQNVLPQRVMIGASWRPSQKIMLACEGAWDDYRYSLFGNTYVSSIVPLAYPGQLKSILIANIGCDYELSRHWGVSAGYSFNTNPVPRSAVLPGFTPNTQNTLTCGIRYKTSRWWAGVAYVVGLPNWTSNHSNHVPPLGIDYTSASVRDIVQNLTYGVGFYL